MTHLLFNGTPGRYDNVDPALVEAMAKLAQQILETYLKSKEQDHAK